ncbi:hypothetical protein ASZ90_005899 [hydrocarbon metagenome]|uniref:Uncharacterized protein n=1 Tax=hydrocarbon metagenome TaxID=938273 RepID=A0A0W8FUA5_9ZZZZ
MFKGLFPSRCFLKNKKPIVFKYIKANQSFDSFQMPLAVLLAEKQLLLYR